MHAPIHKPATVIPIIEDHPMDRLVIDCIDMRTYTEENDDLAWILTCVDVFTLFAWAFTMSSKEANSICKGLTIVINNWGPPKILHSDNGGEFVNEAVQMICDKFNIKVKHGGPYHPQSQGRVERFNQTVEHQLAKAMHEKKTERWIDLLDDVVRQYNITVHSTTEATPFEAMYGGRRPEGFYKIYHAGNVNDECLMLIIYR